MSSYNIPLERCRFEIEVKRSRFIATANYVPTVDAAKAFVREIREAMPDASHHVYAFKVGYGTSVQEGMSDDGEPSGTSGPPILAILRGADIGDIAIVVTRYFGGTKLGKGGLVRAYSDAAHGVLDLLIVEERIEKQLVIFEFDYAYFNRVRQSLGELGGEIIEESFTTHVVLHVQLPVNNVPDAKQAIMNITSGKSSIHLA